MSLPSLLAASTRTRRRTLASDLCVSCSQRRSFASKRMAPNVRLKAQRNEPIVLTPEVQRRRAEKEEQIKKLNTTYNAEINRVATMKPEHIANMTHTSLRAAGFITPRQAWFLRSWRRGIAQGHDPARQFRDILLLDPELTLDDVYVLATVLRNKGNVVPCAKTGRHLVQMCAENGHPEATIQVAASILRQAATKPALLRTHQALVALERLRTISKQGNVRAIVMEAKLAHHKGLIAQAIILYERAIDLLQEQDQAEAKDPLLKHNKDKYVKLQDELSSPWIELAYLYVLQGDHVNARKIYMVGLEKDDPMAYFNLARLDFHTAGNKHTPDWLYNMTKAAASGHYRAAHELGEYYANSPITPTEQNHKTFFHRLAGFAAVLYESTLNLNPKDNITHHEAWANTPEKRIRLADEWLAVAGKHFYLRARVTQAELRLQRYIYPQGTLENLDPFGHSKKPNAVQNPLFDPQTAQANLFEVFTACLLIEDAKQRSTSNGMYRHLTRPWSSHPEALEAVEDTHSLQDIKEQVEMIADAAGIDIKATDNIRKEIPRFGFIRFHKGTHCARGQGLWEADELWQLECKKAERAGKDARVTKEN